MARLLSASSIAARAGRCRQGIRKNSTRWRVWCRAVGRAPAARFEGGMKRLITCFALLLCSFPALAQDKIIVSGASGQLGSLVIEELLAREVAPENLILVSRTPNTEHLQRYAARGASVRFGDFSEPASL